MPWSAHLCTLTRAARRLQKERNRRAACPLPQLSGRGIFRKRRLPYPAPASEGSSRKAKQVQPLCFLARDLQKALRQRHHHIFPSGLTAGDAITLSSTCADLRKAFEDGRPARPSLWLPPLASLTRVTGQLGGVGRRRRLLCAPEQEFRRRSPSHCQPSPAAAPHGRRAPLHYAAPLLVPAQVPDNGARWNATTARRVWKPARASPGRYQARYR